MIKDTCRKCGNRLVPSVGSDLVCPNCQKEYTVKFQESRSWAGVG